MSNYNWTYKTVGGSTRVVITSGEDIRHLGELDQKMWTVLSCPTMGLEIADTTLKLMDTDGDGKLRVNEIVKASQWLCSVLRNPDDLLKGTDSIALTDFNVGNADADQMLEVARGLAGEDGIVSLAQVLAAEAAVADTIPAAEVKPLPEAPVDGGILAAYREKKEAFAKYFEDLRLEELGLASTDPESAPKIKKEYWTSLNEQIGAYEAELAAVNAANQAAADARNAAIAAATAAFQPLIKLLRLKKDFYTLLRNYISFEAFYAPNEKAIFQCGTLIIDQRACDFCVRIQDAGAMGTFAPIAGMYLLFCDCVNPASGKKMSIIAAVTAGDVDDLFVGKNAIFYDRSGLDYDAKVTKIIDNPISIKQAFWSPYKKFGRWIKDLINKSAAEKENKGFEEMKAKATASMETAKAEAAAKAEGATPAAAAKQPFDIAKFAGIFAAIGMAMGFIGSFFVSLGTGISNIWDGGHGWWALILVIIGILLCISGPSMFLAYLKLRERNLAPVLNANGWAVNAKSRVSVKFGETLTDEAKFPLLPDQKKKMSPVAKWLIGLLAAAIVVGVIVLFALRPSECCESCPAATEEVAPAEEIPSDTTPLVNIE